MPWAGKNALLLAARSLSYLPARVITSTGRTPDQGIAPVQPKIGTINGGLQWSVVTE